MTQSVGFLRSASMVFAIVHAAHEPRAQCLEWTNQLDLPGPALGSLAALEVYDDGSGRALVAGGNFATIDGVSANSLARWNGSAWIAIDPLVSHPNGPTHVAGLLAVGNDLYVAGSTPGGFEWWIYDGFVSRIGTAPGLLGVFTTISDEGSRTVNALEMYGGALYAGGLFKNVYGLSANSIASWTNAGGWATLGSGVYHGTGGPFDPEGTVDDLAVFDDGGGPQLWVAGSFSRAGGISVPGLARWNGTIWSSVGPPPGVGAWHALAVFDDGAGPALFGSNGNVLRRYQAGSWSVVGTAQQQIFALAVFDDGHGPALFAGGVFNSIDGVAANGVAKWNGSSWSALGAGVTPTSIAALEVYDDGAGAGPSLYAAGGFTRSGGDLAQKIAAWRPCSYAGTPYCFGDGSLPTPCPCAPPDIVPNPSGASDAGCANKFHASGAKLFASGTTHPDTVRLHGSSLTPIGFSVLIAGNGSDAGGVAYHDGIRCAGGTFVRFGSQYAASGNIVYPRLVLGHTQPLSVMSGVTPGSARTRHYQALYRDASPGFCSAGTLNLTNAVEILW